MRETNGEPNSQTYIEQLNNDSVTLYQLLPTTGRKHQLRVHLSALGIPILNDTLYPQRSFSEDADFSEPAKTTR